ncbi:MAG: hypothetical protein PHU42_04270 [Patescibacteria group bacterium]|nr:hypothetical protein [Patescibacteria group bacterium]
MFRSSAIPPYALANDLPARLASSNAGNAAATSGLPCDEPPRSIGLGEYLTRKYLHNSQGTAGGE